MECGDQDSQKLGCPGNDFQRYQSLLWGRSQDGIWTQSRGKWTNIDTLSRRSGRIRELWFNLSLKESCFACSTTLVQIRKLDKYDNKVGEIRIRVGYEPLQEWTEAKEWCIRDRWYEMMILVKTRVRQLNISVELKSIVKVYCLRCNRSTYTISSRFT
jgi:hypothetical protein